MPVPVALYGGLHKELKAATVNPDFFNAATQIIQAMLIGSPYECIATYPHATEAVTCYLLHAKTHAKTIQHFLTISHIKFHLEQQLLECNRNNGWSDSIIADCLISCAAILNSESWKTLVTNVLVNPDDVHYNEVKQAARLLQI